MSQHIIKPHSRQPNRPVKASRKTLLVEANRDDTEMHQLDFINGAGQRYSASSAEDIVSSALLLKCRGGYYTLHTLALKPQ